jgi:hypothetical protein
MLIKLLINVKKEVFNALIRIKELDLLKSPVDEPMDYATSSKVFSIYSIKKLKKFCKNMFLSVTQSMQQIF